ncbi:MAG: preprotein translocase subunit YajC [Clostridia bacterium]|nr:preprotein translocase subunit YajC [Clostridia bacterium]
MKKNIILAVAAVMLMPVSAFATAGTAAAGGSWMSIIMLVALFAIMYFVMIKPQKKKEQELKAMRDALKVGDEVVTIGGIYGKVIRVKEDRVTLACGAALTKIEFAKWAISGPADEKAAGKAAAKAEETEEAKKPTPKTIKKLGAKAEEAAEQAEEAVQE